MTSVRTRVEQELARRSGIGYDAFIAMERRSTELQELVDQLTCEVISDPAVIHGVVPTP